MKGTETPKDCTTTKMISNLKNNVTHTFYALHMIVLDPDKLNYATVDYTVIL